MSNTSSPSPPIINVKSLIRTNSTLPEQWTLVKEWHIEKRSPYEDWRYLANSQIQHLHEKMKASLEQHPNALLKWRLENDGNN